MQPIGMHEFMNRLFLKVSLEMSKPVHRNNLLIADFPAVRIGAGALKTVLPLRIVHGADKHIKLNQLSIHSKTILLV